MPLRTNTQRKQELRELHDGGNLLYVEERTDPQLRRKVWEVVIAGKKLLLTTATVDGFLMALHALASHGCPRHDQVAEPVDGDDSEGQPAGAGT